MQTREIIRIDEALCDGCGDCVTTCAEGALRLVNGKAKLVNELFCDGFGDCIGECHTGALTIEKRSAPAFDFEATREHVRSQGGDEAVRKLEAAAEAHDDGDGPGPQKLGGGLPMFAAPPSSGCPGSRAEYRPADAPPTPATGGPKQAVPSELRQWPVQLHLVQPGAPFFKDRELVVMSTCAPLASADVHWRFVRGRGVVVACPKLDETHPYVDKLAEILSEPSIPRVTVVRMEVPCCGGLSAILKRAGERSGRTDLVLEEAIVGTNGDVRGTLPLG